MKTNEQTAWLLTEAGEALLGDPDRIPWDGEDAYPRPQMVRNSFLNLNGTWELTAHAPCGELLYEGEIRVPFAPQSVLSGVGRSFPDETEYRYVKRFSCPTSFCPGRGERLLLHFGAVDQIASVSLNGRLVGTHEGGYLPFSFDITDAVQEENLLTVEVRDCLNRFVLPYGKQRQKRGGMWYTPISGIWQTVWMEVVPREYVRSLKLRTGPEGVEMVAEGVREGSVTLTDGGVERTYALCDGRVFIRVENPIHWTPQNPHLYTFTLRAGEDEVRSYFALRTVDVRCINGVERLCLNGEAYYFHGLLDQGYFSDGIYTPAVPEEYRRDILRAKELGFTVLRKHIKVEPMRFYYECDRLGMIVFQDMVNNGRYSFLRDTALPTVGIQRRSDRRMHRDRATRAAFLAAMEETVALLQSTPSVCLWTIFNEGWGQFDSANAYRRLRELDDTRPIDTASGWFRGAPSDVVSPHVYFKPVRIKPADRPVLLSEFGGYSCAVEGHLFPSDRRYGYRSFASVEALEEAIELLYEQELLPAVASGLCGSIYTQLTDLEDEINGLITYDRCVTKVSAERMRRLADRLQQAMRAAAYGEEKP